MKILLSEHIREADHQTILSQEITSLELMERAAEALSQWICNNISPLTRLCFFIGKGGNGGDGLAMARMLSYAGFSCVVFQLFDKELMSSDCRSNLELLPEGVQLIVPKFNEGMVVDSDGTEVLLDSTDCIIDALLGTGTRGVVAEPIKSAIDYINSVDNRVISIDIPSGMAADWSGCAGESVIHSDVTLTIEFPKLAMMLPESGDAAGDIEIVSIDLDKEYINTVDDNLYYIDEQEISCRQLTRKKFAHKGNFGHLLVVCGSEGMIGAALLATSAALRSGVGLVTAHIPANERSSMMAIAPSAMLSLEKGSCFSHLPIAMERYSAIVVGCGLGRNSKTVGALRELLLEATSRNIGMVIDADALNIIAEHSDLRELIPAGSVLTPHIGELRRLVGEWHNEEQKIEMVRSLACSTDSCVVVKGAHTMICDPEGNLYFNSTGNAGMAKGGSGDVLAGYVGGLMARGYDALSAAITGVYFHGAAGDKAADYFGCEGMNSSDLVDMIAEAQNEFVKSKNIPNFVGE